MIEYIIIGILSLLAIFLFIGVRNLLKQNEQLEDQIIEVTEGMLTLSQRTLETMREIDSKGAFESEDEVGAVFEDLKNAVEYLNQRISEYDVREEKE